MFDDEHDLFIEHPPGGRHYIPPRADELCVHPRRLIYWNENQEAYRCARCGLWLAHIEEESEK